MPKRQKIYASGEDYLEAVLILQKKKGTVRSVDVARYLEVSKPSVCHAVATLRDGGFLTMDEDYSLHLTDVGRDVAEQTYDTPTGENGNLLSGGERQRISIARAILKNSPILLLDEATASLDIENELAVKQAIANLLKEKKTVVMIAHTLSIVKNADQILVVADGKIAEAGTHEELLAKNGKYAAMWQAEQKISA